jgi:hypothetical protein
MNNSFLSDLENYRHFYLFFNYPFFYRVKEVRVNKPAGTSAAHGPAHVVGVQEIVADHVGQYQLVDQFGNTVPVELLLEQDSPLPSGRVILFQYRKLKYFFDENLQYIFSDMLIVYWVHLIHTKK